MAKAIVVKSTIGRDGFKKVAFKSENPEERFSHVLKRYSALYKISEKPEDYVFSVVRAVTADIPNENRDCFGEYELLHLKDSGLFTYETFDGNPLLEEHRDEDLTTAGGIVVDSYYDDEESRDKRVMALIAVDITKKRKLAADLMANRVQGFSMGCICEQTRCSVCANIALNAGQYCDHIKNKFYLDKVGRNAVFEWCEGVIFRELSHVKDPADLKALSVETIY